VDSASRIGTALMADICEMLPRALRRPVHSTLERLEQAVERSANYLRMLHYRDQPINLDQPSGRQLPASQQRQAERSRLDSPRYPRQLNPPDPSSRLPTQQERSREALRWRRQDD
jgi:hypothetical protein